MCAALLFTACGTDQPAPPPIPAAEASSESVQPEIRTRRAATDDSATSPPENGALPPGEV